MSRGNSFNIKEHKERARVNYANRQLFKWIDWKIKTFGKIPYKQLMEQRELYGLNK